MHSFKKVKYRLKKTNVFIKHLACGKEKAGECYGKCLKVERDDGTIKETCMTLTEKSKGK